MDYEGGGYYPCYRSGIKQHKTGKVDGRCAAARTNPWIVFVKSRAALYHNGNYAAALADPQTVIEYRGRPKRRARKVKSGNRV